MHDPIPSARPTHTKGNPSLQRSHLVADDGKVVPDEGIVLVGPAPGADPRGTILHGGRKGGSYRNGGDVLLVSRDGACLACVAQTAINKHQSLG